MSTETVPESAVTIDGEDYALASYRQEWTTCHCIDRLHEKPHEPWYAHRQEAERTVHYAGGHPDDPDPYRRAFHVVTRLVATTTVQGVTP